MKIKQTHHESETENVGYELGLLLKDEKRIVIMLEGELGAGKTTFAKGLARAFGIKQIVNSPTYTIMKKYMTEDGLSSFFHLDFYRLKEAGNDFDLEEYIEGEGMIVIEWPYNVREFLPKDYVLVSIKKTGDDDREMNIECVGYPCKRAVQLI
jgi:tRNA threonylcarbamoyladenosine biosynthesis protein TsaE